MSFDEDIQQAVRDSLVKLIRSGDWLKLDYNAKIPIDTAFLRRVQSTVNLDHVLAKLADKIEDRIADAIFNSMATEIATDIKRIMSNTELREDLRAVLRAKMREAAAPLKQE
jgi:hypothetical protein